MMTMTCLPRKRLGDAYGLPVGEGTTESVYGHSRRFLDRYHRESAMQCMCQIIRVVVLNIVVKEH